jgi:hypothetical protein
MLFDDPVCHQLVRAGYQKYVATEHKVPGRELRRSQRKRAR